MTRAWPRARAGNKVACTRTDSTWLQGGVPVLRGVGRGCLHATRQLNAIVDRVRRHLAAPGFRDDRRRGLLAAWTGVPRRWSSRVRR